MIISSPRGQKLLLESVVGWMVTPKFKSTWNLKMSLFGNRTFADIIKGRHEIRSYGMRVGPQSNTSVLIRGKKKKKKGTQTKKEGYVRLGAEWSLPATSQTLPGTTGATRTEEGFPPRAFRGSTTLPTL